MQPKTLPILLVTLLLALTLGGLSASAAPQATIAVNSTADTLVAGDGACTLREAIMNANSNSDTTGGDCAAGGGADIITLPVGVYTLTITGTNEDLNATGDLDITGALTIAGADAATTIVQAGTDATNGIDRVFHVVGPIAVTFDSVTVRYGRAPASAPLLDNRSGGGIFAPHGADLTVTDSIVTYNESVDRYGGGIYVACRPPLGCPGAPLGSLTLTNTAVTFNSTDGDGGGISTDELLDVTITGSDISDNTSGDDGGGVYIEDTLTADITNTTIERNIEGNSYGGGIYGSYVANFTLTGVTVSDNSTDELGGGLYVDGDDTDTTVVSDSSFSGNTAGRRGAGIYIEDVIVDIANTVIDDNSVSGTLTAKSGGGIYFYDPDIVDLDNVTVTNNSVTDGRGGGIWADYVGAMTVLNSTISGNEATTGAAGTGDGGGMWLDRVTNFVLDQSEVRNNSADRDGGGILVYQTSGSPVAVSVDISTSTIDGNSASSGGGIMMVHNDPASTIDISYSTISNNVADGAASNSLYFFDINLDSLGSGGGLFIDNADLTGGIVNSTISGNSAVRNGGGIFMNRGDGSISYTTIASNSAQDKGGGIYVTEFSNVVLQTTIVGVNTAVVQSPDCYEWEQPVRVSANLISGIDGIGGAGYNLISDLSPASGYASCEAAFSDPSNIVDQDPLLGPLQNNGGPTYTQALDPTSPAMSQIPQSSNGCGTTVTDDQRSLLRPGTYVPTNRCEMGAWEAQNAPLAVILASFQATAQTDHMLVTWETASEINNAGFNLYHSLAADGDLTLLASLSSPAPGSANGASYSYQDGDVQNGQTYWYWLESIDFGGATTLHEPISVVYQAPTAVTLTGMSTSASALPAPLTAPLAAIPAAAGLALAAVALLRRRTR